MSEHPARARRKGHAADGRTPYQRPERPGDCLDLRGADNLPAARDQYLSPGLDDPAQPDQLPGQPAKPAVEWVGFENYRRILNDPDIWNTMQVTAHFLIWTIVLQVLIGFTLAWLINRKFQGNDLWTTIIVLPMMLSPAVVGNFWTFFYQPQIGIFNYVVAFFAGADPSSFYHDRLGRPGALVHCHR